MATLHLTFAGKCHPYAELATFLLGKGSNLSLSTTNKSGFVNILTLLYPAGKKPSQTISGKQSIARYLSRISTGLHALYDTHAMPVLVDEYFDALRSSNDSFINAGVKAAASGYLAGSALSLADILVWDYFKSRGVDTPFSTALESRHPELTQATLQISQCLENVPVNQMFRSRMLQALEEGLPGVDMQMVDLLLMPSKKSDKSDFSLAIPKLKVESTAAQDFADKYVLDEYITKVGFKYPFITFQINRDKLRDKLIPQIIRLDSEYGTNSSGVGKTAVIEYSSPNIAKPFHAGHLRSTIIGNFIKNACGANGWTTVSINYLGDWGKQYGLLALGFERYGDREKLKENPIIHLFDVYVKINKDAEAKDENGESPVHNEARAYFTRMEQGDTSALALWSEFRDLSIEKYKEIYNRLNIAFDIYSGESQFSQSQMETVIQELEETGLLVAHEGAKIVELGSNGNAIVCKSDGSMLYLSRDIAAAMQRFEEFQFDKMFYIVANQQTHHFKQLFAILDKMGKHWASRCQHVNFGMIQGMSTRKGDSIANFLGNVVFLEEILNAAQEEMHTHMKRQEAKYAQVEDPVAVADNIGLSAIVVQDMSAKRHKDYEFNWSRMLSFEGDYGPYLQYSHSRMRSIERMTDFSVDLENLDLSTLVEPQCIELLRWVAMYPEVVSAAAVNLEPNSIVQYCFELCHAFSKTYEVLYVKDREYSIAHARLAMYKSTRITLGNAIKLIGLVPLERM